MNLEPDHPIAPNPLEESSGPRPQLISPPGPSRCFPFWQELLACYVVNTDTGDMSGGQKCLPALEDYYECLHHKKEVSGPLVPPYLSPAGKELMGGFWD